MSAASGDRNSRSGGEPAAKRPRLKTPTTRSRRAGPEAVSDSITAAVPELPTRDAPENTTVISMPTLSQKDGPVVSQYVLGEPITAALARYRAWQKVGAPHDTVCFTCQRPNNLEYCITCRRSYHAACKPSDGAPSRQGGSQHWHCDICVGRNWHVQPPPLTPPASPVLAPIQDANRNRWPAVNTQTPQQADAPDSEGRPRPEQNTAPGRTTTNELQTQITPSVSQAQSRPAPPPLLSNADSASASSAAERLDTPPRTTVRARKSKFTTLATDVDSALRILYCELETTSALRGQVSDLESHMAQQRQELEIRQKELCLARKMASMARASDGELARLRAEAAGKKAAVEEADALRADKWRLELELEASRTQLSIVTQSFQELKKKLSALIGD